MSRKKAEKEQPKLWGRIQRGKGRPRQGVATVYFGVDMLEIIDMECYHSGEQRSTFIQQACLRELRVRRAQREALQSEEVK